jgi:hypothetical protein
VRNFTENIDKYTRGPRGARFLPEQVRTRSALMKELVLKGHVEVIDDDSHDLVSHGIIYIQDIEDGKARYKPLEPLMLHALYRHLEKQGCDFTQLLAEWMQQIWGRLDANWADKGAQSLKGFTSEVLLADILVTAAKELQGKPLTEHELFADYKGTFLDDYAILANSFQHDNSDLWKDVLRRKRADVLVLPPHNMRPDLLGLLPCLEGTPSYKTYGAHVIPLTAGVKTLSTKKSLSENYRDNYAATDPWAVFTKDNRVISATERVEAERLLDQTFGNRRRAVRVTFTYRPLRGNTLPVHDQLHIKLDYHNSAFEELLKRHSTSAAEYMKKFVKLQ